MSEQRFENYVQDGLCLFRHDTIDEARECADLKLHQCEAKGNSWGMDWRCQLVLGHTGGHEAG